MIVAAVLCPKRADASLLVVFTLALLWLRLQHEFVLLCSLVVVYEVYTPRVLIPHLKCSLGEQVHTQSCHACVSASGLAGQHPAGVQWEATRRDVRLEEQNRE